jgi:hypothetical protein
VPSTVDAKDLPLLINLDVDTHARAQENMQGEAE